MSTAATDEAPTIPAVAAAVRHQPMTNQQAIVLALVTAILGALGGAGGGMTLAPRDVATASDVSAVRVEIGALDDKLERIMSIIDDKHPRQ